jgi:UDP-N-acetylglucosamine/UDP-N-acetylgalactosamine 4-epimerase
LLETLLSLNQRVVGLDNFATGKHQNLEHVRQAVGESAWSRFLLMEDDIESLPACQRACAGVDYVLHQAALGSVPRSIEDPQSCHASNVTGTLNMLQAAQGAKVKRFVYASSSAIYGDHPGLPKVEDQVGRVLSPYAASKAACEEYAQAFAAAYGLGSVGLRYFNVFGPRQDPEGAYAAVIPRWFSALLKREPVQINGDGETSRDFCFVENVVQANLLAATAQNPRAVNEVYNIALGERTTLNELFNLIQTSVLSVSPELTATQPVYRDFRAGDVRHSLANIDKARTLLGFEPTHRIGEGLALATAWYARELV